MHGVNILSGMRNVKEQMPRWSVHPGDWALEKRRRWAQAEGGEGPAQRTPVATATLPHTAGTRCLRCTIPAECTTQRSISRPIVTCGADRWNHGCTLAPSQLPHPLPLSPSFSCLARTGARTGTGSTRTGTGPGIRTRTCTLQLL